MGKHGAGWMMFIGALGMMAGLLSVDIAKLQTWAEVRHPAFVATLLIHFATVITAFIGGKIIPTNNDPNGE